jgi:hypothetical protein
MMIIGDIHREIPQNIGIYGINGEKNKIDRIWYFNTGNQT